MHVGDKVPGKYQSAKTGPCKSRVQRLPVGIISFCFTDHTELGAGDRPQERPTYFLSRRCHGHASVADVFSDSAMTSSKRCTLAKHIPVQP